MKSWIGWLCGLCLLCWQAIAFGADGDWTQIVDDESETGTDIQELVAITSDAGGNLYVAGFVDGPVSWQDPGNLGDPVSPYSGARDVYVAKLDSTGAPQWHTYLGGTGDDSAAALLLDGDNLYVAGNTADDDWNESWASTTGAISANGDIFLARLDAATGTAQQLFLMGGPNRDIATGLAKSTEGDQDYFYLVGDSEGGDWQGATDEKSAANPEKDDLFVVKLDDAGVMQWHAFYGSTQEEQAGGVLVDDATGSVYVTGTSFDAWGEAPERRFTSAGTGTADIFVLVLDASGTYQRHTFLGGSDDEYVSPYRGLALEKVTGGTDRLYVIGRAKSTTWGASTGYPVREHQGDFDIVIAALGTDLSFSPANDEGWYSFYGGSGTDRGVSVLSSSNDRLFFAGGATADWEGVTPEAPYSSGDDGVVGMIDSSNGQLLTHSFGDNIAGENIYDMILGEGALKTTGRRTTLQGPQGAQVSEVDGYVSNVSLKPGIAVLDGSTELANVTLDLGTVDAWASVTKQLTLRNVGATELYTYKNPIYFQFGEADDYVVGTGDIITVPAGSQPIFPTTDSEGTGILAPGAEVTFDVVFDPVDNGAIDEEFVIFNNVGKGSYYFAVTGTADGSAVVDVLGTDDSSILSGSTATSAANGTDFGTVAAGQDGAIHTFTVRNQGSAVADFTLTPVTVTGSGSLQNFTITEQPADLAAKLDENANPTEDTFTIQFTPKAQGTFRAEVALAQTDGTLYTFFVSGTATGPQASVTGNNADIPSGSTETSLENHTAFEQVVVGEERVRAFTVTNTGTSGSTLDIVDQGGSYVVVEGEGFTLRTDLTDIDLARDEFDTFEVAFSPTDIQNTYNGTVTIKTNDPEEDDSNGYSFAISGRGSDTPNISLSTTGLETWEAEEDVWKQVDVTINYKPTRDVTVSFDISDTNEVMSDKTELVFIWTDTYPNTQSVNFRGVDDGELDLDQVVRVTTSVTSLDPVYDDFPLEDITIVNRNRHFTSTCSQEQYSETVKSGETIICKHATQIDITGTIVRSGGTAGFYAPTVTGSDTTTLEAGSKVQIAPSVDYLDTGK